MFANSFEPIVPPLFEPPPQTEAYEKFAAELAKRQQALDKFLDDKFHALVAGERTRA